MLEKENMRKSIVKQLARKISVPRDCPDIIVAVGPCRSGTTAQLRVFAQASVDAYYQPIKAILRDLEHGKESSFTIPRSTLFIKETVGPYTQDESTLDPVQILLEAGVPKERLHVVAMMREPLATIASWMRVSAAVEEFFTSAEAETLIKNAITTYATVNEIAERCQKQGIATTVFVQESLRDNSPEIVVKHLLERVGLPFSSRSVRGWNGLAEMGAPRSRITFFPRESAPYQDVGSALIHEKVTESDGLRFFPKSPGSVDRNLTAIQVEQLEKGGVFSLYERFRRACQKDLRLAIAPSRELTDFKRRHGVRGKEGNGKGKEI